MAARRTALPARAAVRRGILERFLCEMRIRRKRAPARPSPPVIPTLTRHFDRSPGPWAGAEWRNPEGAPPTPQAPAPGRRPSPARFLRSLRSVEMTVGGCPAGMTARGSALHSIGSARPPPPTPVISTGGPAPGRGGVEKSGGRSIDAAGSGLRPAPVASQISPLAPLGRNDGWGDAPVEMTDGAGGARRCLPPFAEDSSREGEFARRRRGRGGRGEPAGQQISAVRRCLTWRFRP